jgi:hypothetical protein
MCGRQGEMGDGVAECEREGYDGSLTGSGGARRYAGGLAVSSRLEWGSSSCKSLSTVISWFARRQGSAMIKR